MSQRSTPKQKKRKNIIRWAVGGTALAAVIAVVWVAIAKQWLSFDAFARDLDSVLNLVKGHYVLALLATSSACFLLTAVSAPVTVIITFICGILLGRWVGSAIAIVSLSLGATAAILIIRYLAKDFARKHVDAHESSRKLMKGMNHSQNSFLLFLRLVPGFPFWLSNLLLALTDVAIWRFFVFTLIGITPETFIYCNVGASVASVKSLSGLTSPGILIAFGLLALVSLVPFVIKQLERHGVLRKDWPFSNA
ncbi:MAG TPA: VTT domain-containing protein [Gammaproteobacteria bacterium]|jgi:uncharacterized membrane protein YdjX (TVP38/TMEM64 family)